MFTSTDEEQRSYINSKLLCTEVWPLYGTFNPLQLKDLCQLNSCPVKLTASFRNIVEQCAELQQPLSINFVDFKKAFDGVHGESLWNIAGLYGIPEHYVNIFRTLYFNSRCCVRTDTGFTGVRQGCILSPFLFLLVIDFIMLRAMNGPNMGIKWTDSSCLTDLQTI